MALLEEGNRDDLARRRGKRDVVCSASARYLLLLLQACSIIAPVHNDSYIYHSIGYDISGGSSYDNVVSKTEEKSLLFDLNYV